MRGQRAGAGRSGQVQARARTRSPGRGPRCSTCCWWRAPQQTRRGSCSCPAARSRTSPAQPCAKCVIRPSRLSPGDFPAKGLPSGARYRRWPGLLDSPCGMHRWIAAQCSTGLAYVEEAGHFMWSIAKKKLAGVGGTKCAPRWCRSWDCMGPAQKETRHRSATTGLGLES